jgi:hypothetical protein
MILLNTLMSYFDKKFPYLNDAGKITQFSGADNFQNWCTYQPNPYTLNDITYTRNSEGFRSDPFVPSDNSIVYLGCSNTEGVGLPLEETWTYQLTLKIREKTKLDIPYWNLGIGGGGIDSMVRAYYHYCNILNPKIVIALFPEPNRYELKNKSSLWETITIEEKSNNPLLLDYQFNLHHSEREFVLLDQLLERHKPLFFWDTWARHILHKIDVKNLTNIDDMLSCYTSLLQRNHDFARDGMHPGKNVNKNYADLLFAKIGDQICDRLVRPTGVDPVTLP